METYSDDIYAESPTNPDTVAALGPLAPMAGIWEGKNGIDIAPKAAGARTHPYEERIELHPVDPGSNGPQTLYALRYHAFMNKPGETSTYHDQVGYWLWEPAAERVMHSLTIPRGQTLLAAGHAAPDARQFTLTATRGATDFGIVSNPYLETNFRTDSFEITVTIHDDGTWSYDEDTVMTIRGETFHHKDSNRLTRIAPCRPNPLVA